MRSTLFPYTTLFRSEEGVRASVRVILEETCDVLEAENGAAALDLLRVHEVDLVMLDQRMPGEPGIEVLPRGAVLDRKSTRLNSSHQITPYAVFCLKKKDPRTTRTKRQRPPADLPAGPRPWQH